MALLEDLELDKVADAEEVEQRMAAGPIPPVGLHHAVLIGSREGTANTGTKFRELRFQILAGPAKGMEVKQTLYDAKADASEQEKTKSKDRLRLFCHRLGILKKEPGPDGKARYVPIPGITDFSDVIDKATVVLDVIHEDREYEKDGQKKKTVDAKLTWAGIHSTDDPIVKEKKVPLGKFSPGANGSAGTGSLPRKDDYGDI
jgi:hypothetical protein